MLEDRYHRGNYQDVTDRADAPLEDAVALMVRERLTGDAPPASSRKIVELWRDWIEERAGSDLARLADAIEDQARFAGAVRDLLASLEMGDELGSEGDARRSDEGDAGDRRGRGRGRRRIRRERRCRRAPRTSRPPPRRARPAKARSSEADADELIDDSDMSDARDTGEARRADAPFSNLPPMIDYKRLHHALRRDGARPRSSATSPSSTGCAPISTSSSPICRAPSAGSPTACSAA